MEIDVICTRAKTCIHAEGLRYLICAGLVRGPTMHQSLQVRIGNGRILDIQGNTFTINFRVGNIGSTHHRGECDGLWLVGVDRARSGGPNSNFGAGMNAAAHIYIYIHIYPGNMN